MDSLRKKVLLLLSAGIFFGFSYTPSKQWKIIRNVAREWRGINRKKLYGEIRNLYRSRLIKKIENPDGSFTVVLTQKGKFKSLTYRFQEIKIKEQKWDGKWRIVIFDIPEKLRAGRDALREKLKELGFYELQKSVFVIPYHCEDEIDFIIEFFDLRRYVRSGVMESVDNEVHLRQIFNLN